MSGTGRRRKPPTGEEGNEQQYPQQQPYEQPQYQTYAPAPDPQYDYDWRQQSTTPTPPGAPVPPAPPAPSPVPPPAVPQQPQYGDYSGQYAANQAGQVGQAGQAGQYADPYAPPYTDPYAQSGTDPFAQSGTDPFAQSGTDPFAQSGRGGASAPGGSVPGGISSVLGSGQYTVPQPPPGAPPAPPAPQPSIPQPPFVPPQPRPAAPSGGPTRDAFDFDVDLDFDDLGGPASSGPSGPAAPAASPAAAPMPAPATSPDAAAASGSGPAPATSGGGARSGDKDGYRPDDFDFVDTENDPDVGGWLTFTESRADTRAERARRMRVRLIALGVVVVLVAAGVGIYAWLGGGLPGTGSQPQATKSMILFRLDDSTGDAVGDALLVTNRGGSSGNAGDGGNGSTGGSTGTGALVVIPSHMEIDAQGFGSQPFGGNMQSVQPPADSSEVSDILGVTPDGQWTMDETTFHIFVDELGGLSVTTNTAVPPSAADPKGVPRGAGTLTGVQAVAYATYQATGESASVQAARFGQVLEALMAKMPTTSISVAAYLKQLGYIPEPGLPVTTLSPILASLAAQQAAGHVTVATLPLSADGSNTLNASAAAKIVTSLLGGTVKAGASAGQAARVLVQNGTGSSGEAASKLLAAAQAKIVDSGYTFNPGSTVGSQAHTVVEVATSSGQGLAQQVAASLGLSGSAVQVVSGLSSPDDVTVVLGQDWSSLSTQ